MASVSRILESRGVRPLKHKILVPVAEGVGRVGLERMVQRAPVDPGIRYSCYKSFDDLIDVELLKSLDAYVTSKIEEHEQEHDPIFGTGPMTLKASSPQVDRHPRHHAVQTNSASRLSRLFRTGQLELDNADHWAVSDEANEFHGSWTSLPRCLSKRMMPCRT
jgi:hypothetical protein